MMKKNVRYTLAAFLMGVMLCGLDGCSSTNNSGDTEQIISEVENKAISNETEDKQISTEVEEKILQIRIVPMRILM